jgi:Fibronectin type III domain
MATIKMIKALLNFTYKIPDQLLTQGYAIVKALTGNVNFPNLPVDLAVLKAKLDAFAGAIADAKDGSRKAITLRNQMGEEIVRVLQVLAFHVQLNCKDDMNIFLTSGFTPRSNARTAPQPLEPTAVLSVDQGVSGVFKVSMKSVKRAKNYQVRSGQVGPGGATPTTWNIVTVPNAKTAAVINGLTPGTTYAIQVRAYGSLGFTEWSDSAIRMAI